MNYGAGRAAMQVIAAVGWLAIVVALASGVVAWASLPPGPPAATLVVVAAATALSVFLGLLIVAVAQLGLATIATAENTAALRRIAEAQRESPPAAPPAPAPVRAPAFGMEPPAPAVRALPVVGTWAGFEITQNASGLYVVAGVPHVTLEEARRTAQQMAERA